MTTSYKCPNCGAGLIFDPDMGKMSCSFCGSRVYPEDISEKENIEAYHAGDVFLEESEIITCNNCGAEVFVPEDTTSTYCAFCGSASIISSRLSGNAKPLWIAPFRYGREEAKKEFLKWCKGKKLLPIGFMKKATIEKLTGIYMPFWIYDYAVDVKAEVDSFAQRYSSSAIKDKNDIRTVVKRGLLLWEDVPICATREIDDLLIEMIEPFNSEQLEPFAGKYMSGFLSQRPSRSPQDVQKKIYERVHTYVEDAVKESFSTDHLLIEMRDFSIYHPPIASYALLPIWFLHYKRMGRSYFFVLNGQTGRVAGNIPTSIAKVILLALPLSAVLAPILFVLGGLLL